MPKWIILAFIIAAAATPALAERPRTEQFNTKHYNVRTNVDRALAKQIAMHMEAVYIEYERRLAGFRGSTQRMDLYLFGTQEDYLAFLAEFGIDARHTAGIFFMGPAESGLVTWTEGQSRSRMFSILQHEGFHQFAVARISPNLPIWANEGIAEYFAEAVMVRGTLRTGRASSARIDRIRLAIAREWVVPFDELLSMSNEQWWQRSQSDRGAGAAVLYDQAWSMVYFLVHADEKLRAAFMNYLKAINQRKSPEDAFAEAFGDGASPRSFERRWQEYMLKLEPDPITTATMQAEFLVHGMRFLHEKDIRPRAIVQLKTERQEFSFRLMRNHHGLVTEVAASDDENFEPPRPKKSARPTAIKIRAGRDRSVPADVVIIGLEYPIRARWKKDKRGQLNLEVVYE